MKSASRTTAVALESACIALWSATLSLMSAYMHNPAPAHRVLLARRIAANFRMLAEQESFSGASRASFARLQLRWQATAERLVHPIPPHSTRGLLGRLLPFR